MWVDGKKGYYVRFNGMWRGGFALIRAKDKKEVREIITKKMTEDKSLQEFALKRLTRRPRYPLEIKEISRHEPDKDGVLWYDNGDE